MEPFTILGGKNPVVNSHTNQTHQFSKIQVHIKNHIHLQCQTMEDWHWFGGKL